jgi:hypothetical protein
MVGNFECAADDREKAKGREGIHENMYIRK